MQLWWVSCGSGLKQQLHYRHWGNKMFENSGLP
jgi:hypothetical protein